MAMMNVTLEPIEGTIHTNVFLNGVDMSRFIRNVDSHTGIDSVPTLNIEFIGHLEMRDMPADVKAIVDELQAETILAEIGEEIEKVEGKGKHNGGS